MRARQVLEKRMDEMRLISLNCWGGRIYKPLMLFLSGMDADVYCLQEIYDAPNGTPDELEFRGDQNEFPVRPHLFREIAAALPDHYGLYFPSARGHLHDGATAQEDMYYGIATFVRKSMPVTESSSSFVHGEFRPDGWGEPPLPRTAHAMRVRDYATGASVVVAHMHGLYVPIGKIDTKERMEQARKFSTLIASVARPGDKVIACGDFNVLPVSGTFTALRARGLEDLVVGNGFTDTRSSHYKKTPRYADYMLVSKNVQVRDFDVLEQYEVSDHRALLLDME